MIPEVPYISVSSLWKVFGPNAGQALEPPYAEEDQATILEALGCVVALHDVSFDVQQGETFVVMGLSGSGKSTLVRCLIRLIEPTSGKIAIDGQDIAQFSEKQLVAFRRDKLAMVFQHYGLLPHRTVIDNAAWGLEVQGIGKAVRRERTLEVLDMVGLKGWEESYPDELSGGMQQRVGLARALAVDPDILLMDEPFSGLDPLIRRSMQEELIKLQQGLHKTMVFITHDLNEALKLGDRIAIMRDGRIVQIGTPREIVLSPEDEYVSEFIQDVRKESFLRASGVMGPAQVTVFLHEGPRTALENMVDNAVSAAPVVDEQGKYVGVLSLDRARRANHDSPDQWSEYGECIDTDAPSVGLDTPFDQIVPLGLLGDQPISVVNDDGILVGTIPRATLAAIISDLAG